MQSIEVIKEITMKISLGHRTICILKNRKINVHVHTCTNQLIHIRKSRLHLNKRHNAL